MKMSKNAIRILSVVAGALLIIAGAYCLFHQEVAVLSAGFILGLLLLTSGIVEIVAFAKGHTMLTGAGWLLLDGILSVLMSLFLLFDEAFTMLSLPFLFTFWLLFSGISRFVNSFDLKAFGIRGWGWVTAMGVLLIIAGFIGLMDPWGSYSATGLTLGIVFILEGMDSIVHGFVSPSTRD